jgi:hypothetical protein
LLAIPTNKVDDLRQLLRKAANTTTVRLSQACGGRR